MDNKKYPRLKSAGQNLVNNNTIGFSVVTRRDIRGPKNK